MTPSAIEEAKAQIRNTPSEHQFHRIPLHIMRAHSRGYDWTHRTYGRFSDNSEDVQALRTFVDSLSTQPTDVREGRMAAEGILGEFLKRFGGIEDLPLLLGNHFRDIVRPLVLVIEIGEHLERGQEGSAFMQELRSVLEGQLSYQALEAKVVGAYEALLGHFCHPLESNRDGTLKDEVISILSYPLSDSRGTLIRDLYDFGEVYSRDVWDLRWDACRYRIAFNVDQFREDRLWFKSNTLFPSGKGLGSVIQRMIDNSHRFGAQEVHLTFDKYINGQDTTNFAFSVLDLGPEVGVPRSQFPTRTDLSAYPPLEMLKEECEDGLIMFESRGRGKPAYKRFFRVDESKRTDQVVEVSCPPYENYTNITVICPVEEAGSAIDDILIEDPDYPSAGKFSLLEEALWARGRERRERARVIERLEILRDKIADDTELLGTLYKAKHLLARNSLYEGRLSDAKRLYLDEMPEVWRQLTEAGPVPTDLVGYKERPATDKGELFLDLYDFEGALDQINGALASRAFVQEEAFDPESASICYAFKGQVLTFLNRWEEARSALHQGIDAAERLPEGDDRLNHLVRKYSYLGMLCVRWAYFEWREGGNGSSMLEEASGYFEEARNFNDRLSSAHSIWRTDNRMYIDYGTAKLHYVQGLATGQGFERCIDLVDETLEGYLSKEDYPPILMLKFKGCSCRELGRLDEGESALKRSIEILPQLMGEAMTIVRCTSRLELARTHLRWGKEEEGLDQIQQVIDTVEGLIGKLEYPPFTGYLQEGFLSPLQEALSRSTEKDREASIQEALDRIPY